MKTIFFQNKGDLVKIMLALLMALAGGAFAVTPTVTPTITITPSATISPTPDYDWVNVFEVGQKVVFFDNALIDENYIGTGVIARITDITDYCISLDLGGLIVYPCAPVPIRGIK